MALNVHALCGFPSVKPFKDAGHKMDNAHWAAFNLVKCVKNESFNGSSVITFGGQDYRISKGTRAIGCAAFGRWGASRLGKLALRDAVLIPIPSSSLVAHGGDCTALLLSQSISANAKDFPTEHVLAFKEAKQSDHMKQSKDGGEKPKRQSKDEIYKNLKHLGKPTFRRAVLVDDVCTQGFHALAVAAYLRGLGVAVEHVICVGRTIWAPKENPFNMDPEDLEESVFSF